MFKKSYLISFSIHSKEKFETFGEVVIIRNKKIKTGTDIDKITQLIIEDIKDNCNENFCNIIILNIVRLK